MSIVLPIVVFIMLTVPAVSDMRSRDFLILPPLILFLTGLAIKITLLFLSKDPGVLSGGLTGIWGYLTGGKMVSALLQELSRMAVGMLPGAVFLLIQRGSPESLGEGDAFLVLMLGILCGFMQTLFACLTALFFICLYGAAAAIRKRRWENLTLPFLPFLLAGYLVSLVCFR